MTQNNTFFEAESLEIQHRKMPVFSTLESIREVDFNKDSEILIRDSSDESIVEVDTPDRGFVSFSIVEGTTGGSVNDPGNNTILDVNNEEEDCDVIDDMHINTFPLTRCSSNTENGAIKEEVADTWSPNRLRRFLDNFGKSSRSLCDRLSKVTIRGNSQNLKDSKESIISSSASSTSSKSLTSLNSSSLISSKETIVIVPIRKVYEIPNDQLWPSLDVLPYGSSLEDINNQLHKLVLKTGDIPSEICHDSCGNEILIPWTRFSWFITPREAKLEPVPELKECGVKYILDMRYQPVWDTRYIYGANDEVVMYYSHAEGDAFHGTCCLQILRNGESLLDQKCVKGESIQNIGEWNEEKVVIDCDYWCLWGDNRVGRLESGRLVLVDTTKEGIPIIVVDECPTMLCGGEMFSGGWKEGLGGS